MVYEGNNILQCNKKWKQKKINIFEFLSLIFNYKFKNVKDIKIIKTKVRKKV